MGYEVGALTKSIAVMECIAASDEALGVSEIVRRTQLAKNMVFRICQTLCEHGWLETHEPGPRYALTLAPFRLFSKSLGRSNLNEACLEQMKQLRQETGETVYVSVRSKNLAVNIIVLEGSNPLHVAGKIGSSYQLHCCAQGKVHLAFSDESSKDLKNIRLKKFTEKTISTKKALRQELECVRKSGYAINNEEFGRGLIGCASPIFDYYNSCIAAIGIFATSTSTDLEDIENRLAPLVRQKGLRISADLGFNAHTQVQ